MKEQIAIDRISEVAKHHTPAKFIMWLEDNYKPSEKKMEIEILNKDEVFNLNIDTVQIKVEERVFTFTNGVFQSVTSF